MAKSWFQARKLDRVGVIRIYDDIATYGVTPDDFMRDLRAMGNIDALNIHINSMGGNVFDGLAIYNALKAFPSKVTVYVDGIAASIASIIAMAGDEIVMPANAWMMIHDPNGGLFGSADAHDRLAETLRGVKQSLVGIYTARTGVDVDEIEQMMAVETWLNGQQAYEKGFATQVVEELAMAAHLDLSRFSSVPEQARELFGGPAAHLSNKGETMSDKKETATAAVESPSNENVTEQQKKERSVLVNELVGAKVTSHETKPQRPGEWSHDEHKHIDTPKALSEADVQARAAQMAQEQLDKIKRVHNAGRLLGLESEAQKLIDEGIKLEEIPEILIEVKAKRDQQQSVVKNLVPSGAKIGYSNDNPALIRERMSDAIAAQYLTGKAIPDASRQYVNWRPYDFMRDAVERSGRDTRTLTKSQIVDAALHSTSDFPELLGTSANKVFLGAYDAAPKTYASVMRRVDLANFQVHNLLKDGDFPALAEVKESGEFTRGTMSESKETAQLRTYGRTFGITRQSLVNDSLNRFGEMAMKIGTAVARFENATAWAVVTANAAMADGDTLFHANHGNLAGSGGAISPTTLGAGRAAMRLQTSLDGNTINVIPQYLVVPATKETIAEQQVYPLQVVITDATAAPTQSQRMLQIITEPLLDANSTTAWYLFSSPMSGAAIVYGYLEGEGAPRVRTNDPFNVDGIEFQVRFDFYAAAADHRFAYKNAGA